MDMHTASEYHRMIQQRSQHDSENFRQHIIGHVASYDATTNSIRAIIPMYTDDDVSYMESPLIPLVTPMNGNGWGFQYIPIGGATPNNPTNGEEVTIDLHDIDTGMGVASFTFNTLLQQPPGQQLINGTVTPAPPIGIGTNQMMPGELIIRHVSGSYIRFFSTGDVQINAQRDLYLNSVRDTNITVGRNLNETVVGNWNMTTG